MPNRDVEKIYSTPEFVAKLRRLAGALEKSAKVRDSSCGRARLRTDARGVQRGA
jgi:hypothetical protein